ncbi:MAG: hypothetical protein ACHWZW_02860 [Spirulina sp.]
MVDLLRLNERYYSDSHWFAWIGPILPPTDADAARVNAEVERVFQESNKIRECVDRHRRALTAKPAAWSFAHPQGSEGEEFMNLLLGWMVGRSGRSRQPEHGEPISFPNAIAEAVHYRLLGGKGYLRLWLPERLQTAEPWQRVALHSPDPNAVTVERDADGFPWRIIYEYTHADETWREVQELDDQGLTQFRTEDSGGSVVSGSEYALELGGRFTIAEIQGTPIVRAAERRLQDGINYILTLMIRNLQYGGFLRDIIINGMPPGEYDSAGRFIPDPGGWVEGPGAKLEVTGIPVYDAEGNVTGYTTPSVDTRNPVGVEPFLTSYRSNVALLYESFGQGHILSNDLAISGVSRVQLRQDFVNAVAEDAAALRIALSDIYAVAYLLASPAPADPLLSIIVESRLSISDPTPEEVRTLIETHAARLRSTHNTMALLGIENPAAEMEAIAEEEAERMAAHQLTRDDLLNDENDEDGEGDETEDSDQEQEAADDAPVA